MIKPLAADGLFARLCLLTILGAFPIAAPAIADALDDFKKCAELENDEAVAACLHGGGATGSQPAARTSAQPFDPNQKPATKKEPKPEPPIDGNDIGMWQLQIGKSKVDDSESVYLSVLSLETLYDGLRGEVRPRLTLRCKENETDVLINWDTYWLYDETNVAARIDKTKATSAIWSVSTNHVAIFHPHPIAFIRSLIGAEKLFVRATPISENPMEVTFNIHGLRNILPRLKKACHWS